MKSAVACFVLLMSQVVFAAAEDRSSFQFAPPGQALPVIVVSKGASASERFAAEELASHLETMTRRHFDIVDDAQAPKESFIAVGESALTPGYKAADLEVEQYSIDVSPARVIIVGGKRPPQANQVQDRGTLYGVYDVLEQLGVRWYRPEEWGTYIPDLPDPQLPTGKRTSRRPDYVMRSAIGCGFQRFRPVSTEQREALFLWAVRNRLNWNETGGNPKYGGQVHFTFEHSYFLYIPPKTYFAEHPEYFALIDGKRVTDGQLCIGNPELRELFIQKVIAKAKASPNALSITVDPNDGGRWCQCPLCKAMDDPKHPTVMSNRIARFNNMIARRLAAEVPGMKVHWLAYSEGTQAPTNVDRLEPNTIVQLSTINEWGDYAKLLLDPNSGLNKGFVEQLTKWSRLEPSALMTYEYWSGGYAWLGPLPLVHAVADRVRNYRKFNVTGIYAEAEPQWGPQGMNLYFNAKLMWDPDLDLDRELDLYYRNYYGPAAAPMKAYHQTLQKHFDASRIPVYSGGRGMQYLFTPRLVAQLGQYMDQAVSLAKGQEPYERRVHGVWAGCEFARRISQVLLTKKKEGKIVTLHDGRGSYLQSDKAAQQYEDAVKFLLSFYEGDAVFDINLKPPIYGGLPYLKGDVLENDALSFMREEEILKDFK